jgi:cyclic nucleotide gated channel
MHVTQSRSFSLSHCMSLSHHSVDFSVTYDLCVSLQITGAVYYLLSIERQITCWNQQCLNESNTSCDLKFINCENIGSSGYLDWKSNTQVFNYCDAKSANFVYGMFSDALTKGAVSTSFREKYFYCLWWGLLQLR